MTYATKIPTLSVKDENLTALAQLYLQGKGPLVSSMVEAFAFVHSTDRYDDVTPTATPVTPGVEASGQKSTVSDIQFHYAQGTPTASHMSAFNYREDLAQRFMALMGSHYTHSIIPTLVKPQSKGFLQLASSDPFAAPIIDPRYLSHPADLAALVASCRLADRIFHTAAMQANHLTLHPDYDMLSSVVAPNNPWNREEGGEQEEGWWRWYIRHVTGTLYHPVGTCKMGPADDVMAVCDAECRVRGVKGVRVVDASVMPRIVTANTLWPTLMIAERVSAFITAEHHTEVIRGQEGEAEKVTHLYLSPSQAQPTKVRRAKL